MAKRGKLKLPFKNSHAFIIGINNYQHISKLRTAVKDASDIADLLEKSHGYTIYTCFNASRQEMLELFACMRETVQEKDRVIFYFAGHGIALDSEKDPEGFLVPADANPSNSKTLVSMNLLHETLESLPCKHGLLILDCCFAGAFKWSTGFRDVVMSFSRMLYAERFMRFVEHPAWQVITSSAHDQKAADVLDKNVLGVREDEDEEIVNSPFAYALKHAISANSKADISGSKRSDGVITATELYLYLRDFVETSIPRGLKRQSPSIFTLGRHDTRGEFIFINPGHKLNLPHAPDRNPYKGLGSYEHTEDDSLAFFGRKKAVKELRDKMAHTSVLVVSAPSGQGKSSVIKAGLFPELKRQAYEKFHILRPTDHNKACWEVINTVNTDQKEVILIDQYEEMFELPEDERAEYEQILISLSERIDQAIASDELPKLKLIISLRSDFDWQFSHSSFGTVLFNEANAQAIIYRLPPLTLEELREIIVKPAWTVAYEFESEEMVDQILDESNNAPGVLSMLSFTLHQLFEFRDKDKRLLTRSAYLKKLGGVTGALSKHADAVYEGLPSKAHQDFMRKLVLRMVRLNDGSYSRRRVYLRLPSNRTESGFIDELNYPDHLDATKDEVLEVMADALMTRNGQDEFGSFVEPMHDSLINFWPRCLQWIQAFGREHIILQRQLWQALVEHHQWESQSSEKATQAPLWDNNPKLLQVLNVIVDPKDQWFSRINKPDIDLADFAWLLWEHNPTNEQLAQTAIWSWFFKTDDAAECHHRILAQMDNWLNEEEVDFIRRSFEKRQNRLEQLKRERDEAIRAKELAEVKTREAEEERDRADKEAWHARATALAAFAQQEEAKDPTLAWNLAHASYRMVETQDTIASFHHISSQNNGRYKKILKQKAPVLALTFAPACAGNKDVAEHAMSFILIGCADHKARMWSEHKGRQVLSYKGHKAAVLATDFSADRQFVLTGSADHTARLWQAESGAEVVVFAGHKGPVTSVAFSPDGSLILTGSEDKTAAIWDTHTGKQIFQLNGHFGEIEAAIWLPDGNFVMTAGRDNLIKQWKTNNGQLVRDFRGHSYAVSALACTPDRKNMLSGSWDHTARLWDIESGEVVHIFRNHQASVSSVCFSPDGKYLLTGSLDKTAMIRETRSGELVNTLKGHTGEIHAISFSSDGNYIATGGMDREVRIWQKDAGMEIISYPAHESDVFDVAWSADGSCILTGGGDGTARLWDSKSTEEIFQFEGHLGEIFSVAFSPDGKYILTGSSDRTAKLWSAITGKLIQEFHGHEDDVFSVAFSPELYSNRILTAGWDRTARLWDIDSGQQIRVFEGHEDDIQCAVFTPDGSQILTGSADQTVRLWDVENGREISAFEGHTDDIEAAAFSPDGRYFISGSRDKTAILRARESGNQILKLDVGAAVLTLAFSPDGQYILSGHADHTASLWDSVRGLRIRTFRRHKNWVSAVAFSPDGKRILTGSKDGTARIWHHPVLSPDDRIYELSAAERERYGISDMV